MIVQEIDLFNRSGIKVFEERPENLNEVLSQSVQKFPEKEAIVSEEISLTYRELDEYSTKIAAYLQNECLVKPGDRIATVIGNRYQFVPILFACSKVGAIMVPVNVKLSVEEKSYILTHSDIKVLMSEGGYQQEVEQIKSVHQSSLPDEESIFYLDHDYLFSQLLNHQYSYQPVEVKETDSAYILYTSGTTGKPKGAILSHINVIHSLMNYQQIFQTHHDLKTLIAVPLFHVTGLVGQLLHMVYIGGTAHIMNRYQNQKYIDLILKYRINFLFNVPTIFIMMSTEESFQNNSFDFVTKVAFGGSPIYEQTFNMLRHAFPNAELHNAYGSTETTSPATLMPVKYPESKVRSVGKAVPVADIKVVDEQGIECQPGQTGEILIKGPMVVKGYWRNQEANEKNFLEGYWKSGDIGCMDEDGYFYVLDRKKDMISRGGEKIFSIEVEDVLKAHPEVNEAAVVGIPDAVYGERVKAFIASDHLDEHHLDKIKLHCKNRLAKYKVPEIIEIVDELPRNASGKILKTQLKNNNGGL
ncbi:class I adenylate-forming enzyme family protein [Alkalibacillus aidingensis]|uniref:class I adenylate-forming enzyme family protein n=1 Tax=Alkalibacillus aidingensis TaxID=2747607 RepID=UPI001660BD80|nr:class I adenylate-forming enzyme family protein [Alkalibacillus aidingensis]